jgi:predicted  nucleic acid-binding Zn-ribbon protein
VLKVLADLHAIQEKDRQIAQLRRHQKEIPARKAAIEARLHEHQAALKQAEEEWKKSAAAIKEIENEIETHREHITRYRQQQFEVKSNEAYKSLQHEIAVAQQKVREREDREIERMEAGEAARAVVEQARGSLKGEEAEVAQETGALDERSARIDREVAEVEAERARLVVGVDRDWLGRYERIQKHVGDYAVVPVDNGSCGGCHMKLPPQAIHDAKRAQSVTSCAFCSRLLYWPE